MKLFSAAIRSSLSELRSAACAESVINVHDGHVGQPIYARKQRKNEVWPTADANSIRFVKNTIPYAINFE